MFATSPVASIWLEMSINWYTKSQGPKKKWIHFSRVRIHSCPAGTARNQGSFTSMALWSVQSFLSTTVCVWKIVLCPYSSVFSVSKQKLCVQLWYQGFIFIFCKMPRADSVYKSSGTYPLNILHTGQCHPTLNRLLGKGFLNNIMFLASSFFNCRKKLGPILSVISYKEHALAAKYGLRFMT